MVERVTTSDQPLTAVYPDLAHALEIGVVGAEPEPVQATPGVHPGKFSQIAKEH